MRFLPLLLLLLACGSNTDPAVATATLADSEREYELTDIAGTTAQRAVARDPLGTIIEEGFIENGLKQGTWTTYNPDSKLPETVISYLDGALNGPYLETDNNARFTKVANYKANLLHGRYLEYRAGNPLLEANYVDGQLDGAMIEYDYRTRKVKKEAVYRNGQLDGPLRYYNEEGEVMAEWMYEKGERVN